MIIRTRECIVKLRQMFHIMVIRYIHASSLLRSAYNIVHKILSINSWLEDNKSIAIIFRFRLLWTSGRCCIYAIASEEYYSPRNEDNNLTNHTLCKNDVLCFMYLNKYLHNKFQQIAISMHHVQLNLKIIYIRFINIITWAFINSSLYYYIMY